MPDRIDGGGGVRGDHVSVRGIGSGPGPSVRSETIYELTLKDGSRLYGTIEQEDDTSIVFRSVAGVVITAPRADLQSLRAVIGTLTDGEFWPAIRMRRDCSSARLPGRFLKGGHTSACTSS